MLGTDKREIYKVHLCPQKGTHSNVSRSVISISKNLCYSRLEIRVLLHLTAGVKTYRQRQNQERII